MPRSVLTSSNNPLRIAELPFGQNGGIIGITFAPGKQQSNALSGAHRRDLAADLDLIAAWNGAAVVTLVETHELKALGIAQLGEEVSRRHMEWRHWPIRDHGIPDAAFESAWPARSVELRSLLECGGRVLVHCKGGLGRAGMVSARLLVEGGMSPKEAIGTVRAVRPGAIETGAQEEWVNEGVPSLLPKVTLGTKVWRDRSVGALLGLAVGDAVGAALEFSPKPRFAVLDDMRGGGPHRLERGQWTDDTAMAVALADSLLQDPALDPDDLICRFADWQERGTYSCTGTCFDIGNATAAALNRFRRNGDPLAGSTAESASGNGALMRLSPVTIRHHWNAGELHRVAALQTRTTHGSPATISASHIFVTLLADAIRGGSLPQVLSSVAADEIEGGWRGLHRDQIEGSGYVVRALQAAVWAVSRTTDFRSAILLAANLGQDADTTSAIAGQLAGAIYGVSGIPQDWLDALAWRERLEDTAGRLFDAAWEEATARTEPDPPTLGSDFAAPWMTGDWTLQQRLAALAAFRPIFAEEGFRFAEIVPGREKDGVRIPGYPQYSEQATRLTTVAYDYGWVRKIPWPEWHGSESGKRLLEQPEAMAQVNDDDLAWVLTTIVRGERFSDGCLAQAFDDGLIGRVIARAESLLAAMPTFNN